MDEKTRNNIEIGLEIAKAVAELGIPAVIEWKNGRRLENPTLEDIRALHNLVPKPDYEPGAWVDPNQHTSG